MSDLTVTFIIIAIVFSANLTGYFIGRSAGFEAGYRQCWNDLKAWGMPE